MIRALAAALTLVIASAGPASAAGMIRVAVVDQARTVGAGLSGRTWWIYLAFAAFGLVLAEWWTWQRRITV